MDMEAIGILGTFVMIGAVGAIGILWGIVKFFEDKEAEKQGEVVRIQQERVRYTGNGYGRGYLHVDDRTIRVFSPGTEVIDSSVYISIAYNSNQGFYGVSDIHFNRESLREFLAEGLTYKESKDKLLEVLRSLVANSAWSTEAYDKLDEMLIDMSVYNELVSLGKIVVTRNHKEFDWDFNA